MDIKNTLELNYDVIKQFEISGISDKADILLSKEEYNGACVIDIKVISKNGEALDLSEMMIMLRSDAAGTAGRWYPKTKQHDHAPHNSWEKPLETSFMNGAPVFSYFKPDESNKFTAALSDTFTAWSFNTGLSDLTKSLEYKVKPKNLKAVEYNVKLLFDVSERPYYEAIRNVADWWGKLHGYMAIPENAYDPVYSTWYVFQREIFADELVEQCRLAYDLGCRTIFVDDGWATPLNTLKYNDAGDWKPTKDKFPDMREFVDKIHELGMKAVLWVAPPLSGFASKSAERFKGKFLATWEYTYNHILDIRYPEIRKSICESFKQLIEEYDYDGFKIDFIDSIVGEDKPLADGRDFVSVAEAVRALLFEINEALVKIKNDVMIEYRQNYTSPDALRTASIVRAADCPQDYLSNRMAVIDLRLHTNAACHSDMIQFNEYEEVEASALQFTNVLFSTPQVSVKFDIISEEQKKMIKFYLGFMSEKRNLLQKSSLAPHRCDASYSYVTAENDEEQLTALYSEKLLILENSEKKKYIVNAVDRGLTYIGCEKQKEVIYTMLDCMGNEVASGKCELCENPKPFNIPFNGMMIIC